MGQTAQRLRAIDVLRGLTLALMIVVNMQIGPGKSYTPLLHSAWNGLTPTDVVFPTFMFLVGAALGLTLGKYAAAGNTAVTRSRRGPLNERQTSAVWSHLRSRVLVVESDLPHQQEALDQLVRIVHGRN